MKSLIAPRNFEIELRLAVVRKTAVGKDDASSDGKKKETKKKTSKRAASSPAGPIDMFEWHDSRAKVRRLTRFCFFNDTKESKSTGRSFVALIRELGTNREPEPCAFVTINQVVGTLDIHGPFYESKVRKFSPFSDPIFKDGIRGRADADSPAVPRMGDRAGITQENRNCDPRKRSRLLRPDQEPGGHRGTRVSSVRVASDHVSGSACRIGPRANSDALLCWVQLG